MRKLLFISIITISTLLTSCTDDRVGETVESAYLLPILPPVKYSFKRNGSSSVDYFECDLINEPIDNIYAYYMKRANISNPTNYQTVMKYYNEGADSNGVIPSREIATSPLYKNQREKINQDILNLIETSAKISGYGNKNPASIKLREAEKGLTGYIGNNYGDINIAFADEKGIIVAEVFKTSLLGAIQLDKIMNQYLDDSILDNPSLRKKHENLELLPGKNYTELEHAWDLAYGYYLRLRPIVQAESTNIIRNSDNKILTAFVQGRHKMEIFHYDEMKEQQKIILTQLSKVFAVKTIKLLLDKNTLANLNEQVQFSFPFISQAYGYIYSLQFLKNIDRKQLFTYQEVKNLQNNLIKENGLWDEDKLLGSVEMEGSLLHTATIIAKAIGIDIENIRN